MKSPKEVTNDLSNWVGWKTPKRHLWNLNYQDMLDLSTICYNYLIQSNAKNVQFGDVGACIGNATSVIATYAKEVNGRVISSDIFIDRQDWPGQETKNCWFENMKGLSLLDNIELNYDESIKVANRLKNGTMDLVYIDASHIYKDIKADILAWWPKIKKGGIMCGHDCELNATPEQIQQIKENPLWSKDDCTEVGHAGVIVATKEFFGDNLQQRNHTWWVKKN